MNTINAPYNFVPLSDKIFYPKWSMNVSHDVPFSDGECGEIELEVTAKSPIFIKNNPSGPDKVLEFLLFL